jgi:hypothetical protein
VAVVALGISLVIGVLLALWLVLRLKPKRLKLKATVTKWASFELEMMDPEREKTP